MASLELLGFEDLDDAFRRISDIPDDVTADALDAMAQVAAERIKQSGEAMGVRDPESTVHILDKVTRNKAKMSWSGGYEDITFAGTRTRGNTRTRNAEIAFINEYGRRKEEARLRHIRPAACLAHGSFIYAAVHKAFLSCPACGGYIPRQFGR